LFLGTNPGPRTGEVVGKELRKELSTFKALACMVTAWSLQLGLIQPSDTIYLLQFENAIT